MSTLNSFVSIGHANSTVSFLSDDSHLSQRFCFASFPFRLYLCIHRHNQQGMFRLAFNHGFLLVKISKLDGEAMYSTYHVQRVEVDEKKTHPLRRFEKYASLWLVKWEIVIL